MKVTVNDHAPIYVAVNLCRKRIAFLFASSYISKNVEIQVAGE